MHKIIDSSVPDHAEKVDRIFRRPEVIARTIGGLIVESLDPRNLLQTVIEVANPVAFDDSLIRSEVSNISRGAIMLGVGALVVMQSKGLLPQL
jgi:hypothetical protein